MVFWQLALNRTARKGIFSGPRCPVSGVFHYLTVPPRVPPFFLVTRLSWFAAHHNGQLAQFSTGSVLTRGQASID